jgi:4-amino-4-deoxychorismate lyase
MIEDNCFYTSKVDTSNADTSNVKLPHTVDIGDRGLAYGDGLFETIAYVNGALNHWKLHWQRLQSGAQRLAINLPAEHFLLEQINLEITQSLSLKRTANNASKKALSKAKVIKIIITRGKGGRGYLFPEQPVSTIIVSVHPWPDRDIKDYQHGINATICHTCLAQQPALAGIKHLNRLEQVLARNEIDSGHYQDGIMLACSSSMMIEGTSSNLFFVINDRLLTSVIDTCGVQGTMRQAILTRARQMDIPVEEGCYSLKKLESASDVFLTNSIYGIVPVASVSNANEQELLFDSQNMQSTQHSLIPARLSKIFNKQLNRPEIVSF